jgi:putative inorganic carbon (hco3(-)) transporter
MRRSEAPLWRWASREYWFPDTRSLVTAVVAVGVAIALGCAIAFAAAAGNSMRPGLAALAAVLVPLLALASGNPRLFFLWGLMFALPFDFSVYLGSVSDRAGGERAIRIEMSDPMFLALLAFQVRDVVTRRWPGFRVPRVILVWLGIMLFWGVGTVIVGRFRYSAAYEVFRMIKVAVLFVVLVNELDSPGRIRHAVMALAFSVLFQSGFGLAQWVHGRPFGLDVLGELGSKTAETLAEFSVRNSKVFRVSAFVLHPNLFGIFLAACLPLVLGALLIARSLAARLFLAVTAGAGFVCLILTQSRSAWVAFAAAVAVTFVLMLMHRRLFSRAIAAAAVGMVAIAVVFGAFQEPIMNRLFDSKEDAAVGREEFKEDARRLIDDKIMLGWGLNQYVQELPPYMKTSERSYSYWIPPVHNIYYLWWAETGFIGLCVHLMMWSAIAIMAIRNLRVEDDLMFIVNVACLAAMVAFAVDGFLSFSLRVNAVSRTYWMLAAMIYATYYWRHQQHTMQRLEPPGEQRLARVAA